MKRKGISVLGVLVMLLLFPLLLSPARAETKGEAEFMTLHEKEMTPFIEKCSGCHTLKVELRDKEMKKTFVEKCSQCHTLGRLFSKKRSPEEWDRVLKVMAGKPHANLSEQDLKKIQQWIDYLRTVLTP
jgi:mono/diheme cytochrome c family protein